MIAKKKSRPVRFVMSLAGRRDSFDVARRFWQNVARRDLGL